MSDYEITDLDPVLAGRLLSNRPEKNVGVYIEIKMGALIMLWPFVTDAEPTQEYDPTKLSSMKLRHLARSMRRAMYEQRRMIHRRQLPEA